MEESLSKGIPQASIFSQDRVIIADSNGDRWQFLEQLYSVATSGDNTNIWSTSDTVILAVKPQIIDSMLHKNKENVSQKHLIITTAAGSPLSFYNDCLKCSLPHNIAETPTGQTIPGSAKPLRQSGDHPAIWRSLVMPPVGTAIARRHILKRSGFSRIIIDAIEAAIRRSSELSSRR